MYGRNFTSWLCWRVTVRTPHSASSSCRCLLASEPARVKCAVAKIKQRCLNMLILLPFYLCTPLHTDNGTPQTYSLYSDTHFLVSPSYCLSLSLSLSFIRCHTYISLQTHRATLRLVFSVTWSSLYHFQRLRGRLAGFSWVFFCWRCRRHVKLPLETWNQTWKSLELLRNLFSNRCMYAPRNGISENTNLSLHV